MDDSGPMASYIIFFVLLLVDMLFYGFGAAVKELNAKELAEQFEEKGNKKAGRLYEIAIRPEQYINTVQLVVTLIHLVMGAFFLGVLGRFARKLIEKGILERLEDTVFSPAVISVITLLLAGAVLLYILLTFGVLIPKKLGVRYAEKWSYACINPIYYITKMFSPITGLVSVTSKGILRLFGINTDDNTEDVTEEEIISMVNDYMLSESKSRFPVFDENIDNIIGILHFRDAMRAHREEDNMTLPVGSIEGLLREPMFVPETKNIDALFQTMQHTKTQMVIVVDEYGQTTGLIAMEDILEEIVGNIMDEYDEDEAHIEETGNADEYIIEGITPLEELEERFGIIFKEEAFETLNGFLISKMDKIPEEDEEFCIDVDGYEFKILQVKNRMIKSVLVTKLPEKKPENENTEVIEENETEN